MGKLSKFCISLVPLAIVLASCSTATTDESTRDEEGAIVEGGDVGVLVLTVGDCFDEADGSVVEAVATVPCDEPHDNQVYASFNLPAGDWPGSDVVDTSAEEGCLERFEPALGEPYDTSPLATSSLTPLEDGWAQGDYEVVCYAYDAELSQLTEDLLI